MIPLVDDGLAPGLSLLGLWSLRWGLLIAAFGTWIWWRAPRAAAVRLLAAHAVLLAGLALPFVPRLWGPQAVAMSPAERKPAVQSEPLPAVPLVKTAAEHPRTVAEGRRRITPTQRARPQQGAKLSAPSIAGPADPRPALGAVRVAWLLLGAIWSGGVAIALGRLLWGMHWLRRYCRGAVDVTEPYRSELRDCSRALGVTRSVELTVHAGVSTPLLVGGRRARVLVPGYWPELSAAARRAILLHELAHVVRRDDLAKLG